MASTFSPILRIELIGTGDQTNTWGDTTNVNLGTLIEQAIAGTATINVTSGNVTLSNLNGATDQARCMALKLTGTPGVSRNVIAPAVSKVYIVANGSDAAIVLKTSTSTGLTIPASEIYLAYYDPTSGVQDFKLVGRSAATTNTANAVVLRDASGNFAAGTITANLTGNVAGTLTGTIASSTVATTQSPLDNSTKVATTAYVETALSAAAALLGTMSTQDADDVAITGGSITGITDLAVADGGTGRSTLAANAVLVGNGTSGVNSIAPGTAGNILTSNGTAWASTPLAQNSITLLGTATTTSGTSQAITGLTLTGYKQLYFVVDNVGFTGDRSLRLSVSGTNSVTISDATGSGGTSLFGTGTLDLATGIFSTNLTRIGTTSGIASNTADNGWAGKSNVTNSATEITFTASGDTFDSGAITVYGLK
jgi:hypothetical protein